MEKLDWKGVGQLIAVLVQVWSIIKGVVEKRVGLEMLGWIVGDGKDWFRDWFQKLVEECIVSIEFTIDFDSTPSTPSLLLVASEKLQIASRVRGKKKFSEIGVLLHLDDDLLRPGGLLTGSELSERLVGKQLYGAQLLDFYLKHPDLIPEDFKTGGAICFWGTIYRDLHCENYVRYLKWDGSGWVSNYFRIGRYWDRFSRIAIAAN